MRERKVWLVKRPSGIYQLRWWAQHVEWAESTGTRDAGVAEQLKHRKIGELAAGQQNGFRGIDLADLLKLWEESRPGAAGRHEEDVRVCANRFLAMMGRNGRLRTDRIDAAMVDRYCNRRRSERSVYVSARGTTISRPPVSQERVKADLRMLRALFTFGIERIRPKALIENPVPLAASNKVRSKPRQHAAFTDVEFRALLKAAPDLQTYAFLLAAWNTGARRSELSPGVYWYDVDFQAHTIRTKREKTQKEAVLPMLPELEAALVRLHSADKSESGSVWKKDPLGGRGMKRFCIEAGIQHHRFHDFRLTCSSRLRALGGLDDQTAADFVGHSKDVQRRHYTDMTPYIATITRALQIEIPGPPGE